MLLGLRMVDPASGKWSFPAGYVNRGEVLEEAAIREVLEEFKSTCGLGLVGVYSAPDDPVILVVYAGGIVDGAPRPDGHEVAEVRCFPLDALPRAGVSTRSAAGGGLARWKTGLTRLPARS